MAGSDNLYSQFVNWSKIILPLAALALLSTLFLFAKRPNTGETIPYAEIQDIAQDPRLTHPQFSGMTTDGSVITVGADMAIPDAAQPNLSTIQKLTARIESVDGSQIDISAGQGRIDTATRTVTMTDLVRIQSSAGYDMETTGLTADLAAGRISSTGPLEVRAPYGQLTAGHLLIEPTADGSGKQMVFNQGVRLLYQPQQ